MNEEVSKYDIVVVCQNHCIEYTYVNELMYIILEMGCCAMTWTDTMRSTYFVALNVILSTFVLHITLCKYTSQQTLQPAQTWRATATADGQQCSSCGTANSEEDKVIQPPEMEAPDALMDEWEALSAGIEAIVATQLVTIKKMSSMDKAIATMQVDMNWVREDMRVVHKVVDKVAEHVCELTDVTAEVEKLQQQTCVTLSPWGTRGVAACVEDHNKATVQGTAQDGSHIRLDTHNTHIPIAHEDVCSIQETQPIESNVEMHANISSLVEEGGGWRLVLGSGPIAETMFSSVQASKDKRCRGSARR